MEGVHIYLSMYVSLSVTSQNSSIFALVFFFFFITNDMSLTIYVKSLNLLACGIYYGIFINREWTM